MRIVLDTNVLVSGLLRADGPPGRILDGALAGELSILVDDRILSEYGRVLRRPKFGFDPDATEAVLTYLRGVAEPIPARPLAPSIAAGVADPGDLPFLEVAMAGAAGALVTGNRRDFPTEGVANGPRVVSPREFVVLWAESLG